MSRQTWISLVPWHLVIVAFFSLAIPVQAQGTGPGSGGMQPLSPGNLPSYLSMNTDGKISLNTSALTAGQPIFLRPEGLPSVQMTIGGQTICAGCLTFNSYTTPTGSTVVVPTA